jgi:hypothetical protein
MSFLHQEPFAGLPSDFDKISPESLTAFYEISFSGANIQRLNLENRVEDIRNSSSGANGTGATVYLEDKADGKSSKNLRDVFQQLLLFERRDLRRLQQLRLKPSRTSGKCRRQQ